MDSKGPGPKTLPTSKAHTREHVDRSVAILHETRNGVRSISGAKNQAMAMAFGGPHSSCVRPGAHSARRQDSRKDLAPCRMALHVVSAGAHAPHSDETLGPKATRGSSHSARRLRSLAFLCSSEVGSSSSTFLEYICVHWRLNFLPAVLARYFPVGATHPVHPRGGVKSLGLKARRRDTDDAQAPQGVR